MSNFWNIWVWVLTLGSLVGCFLLLRMCLKNFAGVEEGESMGHTFDGIEELNNPLPKWWSTFFLLTIVWAFGYIALYGLGNWTGLLGWKSSNQGILNIAESKAKTLEYLEKDSGVLVQYDREVAAADAKFGPIFEAYAARSIEDLASDDEALKVGQRLFIQNCSQCHGSDAHGTTGFPNLTDGDWLYGGNPADIKATIMNGRAGVMPGWLAVLGDEKVDQVTTYVVGLSGRKVNAREEAAGKEVFLQTCSACHGADAKGMTMLGAPNLTDKTWLYGGSRKAIEQTVKYGRNGVMPAWSHILGEDKVMLLSSYVYSLSVK